MTFTYVAFDKSGKSAQGSIEAGSASEATDTLRARGLFVTSVVQGNGDGAAAIAGSETASRKSAKFFGRARRLRNLVTFTRQLHVLVSSGTPLVQSLTALERQSTDVEWRNVIVDVRQRVEEGAALSNAMEHHPQYFDNLCRSLVRAGEAGGHLEAMLERLAKLVRSELHVRSSIRGAMVYPCLLIFISITVLSILLCFVLPRFAMLFQNLGSPLPPTTKVVMLASDILRGYWWLLITLIGCGVFGFRTWAKTSAGKRMIDRIMIDAPALGTMTRSFSTARVARILGIQIDSKVPLLEALHLTREACGNVFYAELVAAAEDAATRGLPVSSAFERTRLISPAICEAIRNGEQSGQMASLLVNIADFLDEENEIVVRSLSSIIEPVILIVLGVLVGFVALSMFLPLFDLTATTSAGG
jgi:type II secretory pathway component PulF